MHRNILMAEWYILSFFFFFNGKMTFQQFFLETNNFFLKKSMLGTFFKNGNTAAATFNKYSQNLVCIQVYQERMARNFKIK